MLFDYEETDGYESVLGKIKEWISHPQFVSLLKKNGYEVEDSLPLEEKIRRLIDFSDQWDFRGMQNRTRWEVADQSMDKETEAMIYQTARTQELMGCQIPQKKEYDYGLVLGGARMSCLFRMKYAKKVCEDYGLKVGNIAGLAGMRPVMDTERTATDTYAPDAQTEFDLMRAAMYQVYEQPEVICRKQEILENLNASWSVEEYQMGQQKISLLAAPSGEPQKRRTNTADTFSFFVDEKEVGRGKKLLLITSQIYVPYQQLEAVRMLGIPFDHSVETIGFPGEWSAGLQGLQKPENYLQEMRSVLQAAGRILSMSR